MPKARAISRLPTLPERASMKARSSGLLGRPRGFDFLPSCLANGSAGSNLRRDWMVNRPPFGVAWFCCVVPRAPRVRAEPAAPSALELLFRNQGHGAVEADVEDIVPRLEARIGLAVLHIRTVSAETGEDRFARLRMQADLARKCE